MTEWVDKFTNNCLTTNWELSLDSFLLLGSWLTSCLDLTIKMWETSSGKRFQTQDLRNLLHPCCVLELGYTGHWIWLSLSRSQSNLQPQLIVNAKASLDQPVTSLPFTNAWMRLLGCRAAATEWKWRPCFVAHPVSSVELTESLLSQPLKCWNHTCVLPRLVFTLTSYDVNML